LSEDRFTRYARTRNVAEARRALADALRRLDRLLNLESFALADQQRRLDRLEANVRNLFDWANKIVERIGEIENDLFFGVDVKTTAPQLLEICSALVHLEKLVFNVSEH